MKKMKRVRVMLRIVMTMMNMVKKRMSKRRTLRMKIKKRKKAITRKKWMTNKIVD